MPSAARRGSFIPRGAITKGNEMHEALSRIFAEFSVAECDFFPSYPLSGLTTLRIGGVCTVLAVPKSAEVLVALLSRLEREGIPRVILGNGSNMLAPDEGYNGVVIRTTAIRNSTVFSHTIEADCGASLASVVRLANANGILGFSHLAGIPATLGGAIFMNAGAFGECIGDRVITVRAVPAAGGAPITLTRAECLFDYRKSIFQAHSLVILSARLSGGRAPVAQLERESEETLARRAQKQPLDLPSAGSAFRRPEGDYAGRLIEAAGLSGFAIGGASVSLKHAGFIVNHGGATAHDVKTLIEHIRNTVMERFGVMLVREIEYLGE